MPTATRRLGLITQRSVRLMTDTVSLARTTTTQDSSGGQVDVVATLGPYPVRLEARQATSLERIEGGRLEAVTVWKAYLPAGTVVLPADRMTINGQAFEVVDDDAWKTDPAFEAVTLRLVR